MKFNFSDAGVAFSSVVVVLYCASFVSASEPIFGGPIFDSATGTGFDHPWLPGTDYDFPYENGGSPAFPGSTVGAGVGVGRAEKYVGGTFKGSRAIRWNEFGWVELGVLETADGVTRSAAFAVNAAGTVVGYSREPVTLLDRAVRWTSGSTIATQLGDDLSFHSYALAINEMGTVVGYASNSSSLPGWWGSRAARWTPAGAEVLLDSLGASSSGHVGSIATAVNTAGLTVGWSAKYSEASVYQGDRAVRWEPNGVTATELGHLGTNNPNTWVSAWDVNDSGTAVGHGTKYAPGVYFGERAIRWDANETEATELGSLGFDFDGITFAGAYAINSAGTAVGRALKYGSGFTPLGNRAVRWDASGTAATELGFPWSVPNGAKRASFAIDINDAGTVVGIAEKVPLNWAGYRAVFWGSDGTPTDLNSLLSSTDAMNWTLLGCAHIDNNGWVTGIGLFDPDGPGPLVSYERTFLMRIPGAGTSSCPECVADFDGSGGVDGADLAAFFSAFEAGAECADVDGSGGVDGADLSHFFAVFEAGGCD